MISGYLNSTPFPVYNYGEIVMNQMIPPEPHSNPSRYYIKWRPSYISSGTFTVSGVKYNFSSYPSGIFWFDSSCSGYWDDMTYRNSSGNTVYPGISNNSYITYFETNLLYVGRYTAQTMFSNLPNISMFSMSYCKILGGYSPGCLFDKCGNENRYVSFYLPECSYIYTEFASNTSDHQTYVSEITLPACIYLPYECFSNHISITLYYSGVVPVGTGGGGYTEYKATQGGRPMSDVYIYVPSSRVNSYINSPYWSRYYSSRIFPIPE